MSTAISGVKIEKQAVVDVNRPAGESAQVTEGEESMAEYAARREAEMRGEKPPVKETPAAAVATDEGAAATEAEKAAAAAAKPSDEEGKKKAEASAAEEDPDKLLEETHPAKKGISKRMGELTQKRKDAEEAAEQARQEAAAAKAEAERLTAELKAAKEAAERAPVVPKAEEDPAPDRDDFDDPDEYQAAYTSHAARQEIRKANEAAEAKVQAARDEEAKVAETKRQAKVQKQIAELHQTFNDRVEASKADLPDYDVKVTNNEKLVLRNDIFFTIEQSELAPNILYHLADHPDEAASLNGMPPIKAAMRIGEIQAEIRIARKPKPSKAAEPVKPVGHRSSPERKTPDEETMEEYAARREREEADKRAAARRRAH